ncbi:MAG: hypothetical protein LBF38_12865 [Deltaproteobacteria bacterium]|jgi:hypothetical protein|nr:hypothetical protein [Deltaproteobacteria bacterium]
MTYYDQPMPQSDRQLVTFWDIFKNSWKILWENPKPLVIVLVSLSVLQILFDYIGMYFLGPFYDLIDSAMRGQFTGQEFLAALREMVDKNGTWPLIAGKLVPWLLGPFVSLALARSALNLWDGYQIGLSDLGFALKKYPAALYVCVLVALLAIFLLGLVFASYLPMVIIHSLFFGQGLPGPFFAILSVLAFSVSLFLFIKYVWPLVRRYLFLQYMAFFSMVEGFSGSWVNGLMVLFRKLKAFPRHLNQAIITTLALFLSLSFVLIIVSAVLANFKIPPGVIELATEFLYLICVAWIMVALSGFYRLYLSPEPSDLAPNYPPET